VSHFFFPSDSWSCARPPSTTIGICLDWPPTLWTLENRKLGEADLFLFPPFIYCLSGCFFVVWIRAGLDCLIDALSRSFILFKFSSPPWVFFRPAPRLSTLTVQRHVGVPVFVSPRAYFVSLFPQLLFCFHPSVPCPFRSSSRFSVHGNFFRSHRRGFIELFPPVLRRSFPLCPRAFFFTLGVALSFEPLIVGRIRSSHTSLRTFLACFPFPSFCHPLGFQSLHPTFVFFSFMSARPPLQVHVQIWAPAQLEVLKLSLVSKPYFVALYASLHTGHPSPPSFFVVSSLCSCHQSFFSQFIPVLNQIHQLGLVFFRRRPPRRLRFLRVPGCTRSAFLSGHCGLSSSLGHFSFTLLPSADLLS